jgi:hypothetical protein
MARRVPWVRRPFSLHRVLAAAACGHVRSLTVAHGLNSDLNRFITENPSNIQGALDRHISSTREPTLLLLHKGLGLLFGHQAQPRAPRENFIFKRRIVPRTNNFPKIIFKTPFNLPRSLAY